MSRRVVILGAGGFACELGDMLQDAGFVIDGCVAPDTNADLPFPWLGGDEVLATLDPGVELALAIGSPKVRRAMLTGLPRPLLGFVHPTAWVAPSVRMGAGCIVYPNVTIHAHTVLEDGVLVNSNATIGHHGHIGAGSTINPGAALGGHVHVGAGSVIGIGAAIRQGLRIGDNVMVGAGAAVVSDLADDGTYVGVPAKPLRG